ncbi:alpha/beta hydrolase [Rhodococcus sp. NPDC059234]|uniref:alpha/beta hydrolase n=1 Tax=Rhodococcus sp. NPDC059234 TaxID=3346781 RepID=UPI00366BC2DA
MSQSRTVPVVFVHGLWMHPISWGDWVDLFTAAGYDAIAPGWPGDATTVEATRQDPDALNKKGIGEATEHYAALISRLPDTPIVVGHSFGGLIAQRLLGRGLARAAVALAPAQFKGVLRMSPTQIRSVLPVVSRPGLRSKTWSHTPESFHATFANAVARDESDRIFADFAIPAPGRPLFQAALANVAPGSPAKVDTRSARGPLLMVAGGQDRLVPEPLVQSAYNIQRRNLGVTEYQVFPDRGHSLAADHGWREVADAALDFLERHDLAPSTPDDQS